MIRFVISRLTVLVPLFLLTGCIEGYCFFFCYDSVPVQGLYSEKRDQCQLLAERKIILYEDPKNPPPPKERNTILLALFSECMHGKDWGVTAPKREVTDGYDSGRVRVRQTEPARRPDIAENDVIITSEEDERSNGRVVLPDRMYADPKRELPRRMKPRSGPLVGQGIGPGYEEATPEYDDEPEYYPR